MPHNLYLHSALVQSRRIGDDHASKATACRYNLIDSAIALNAAFFVNAAILVLSAAVFHRNGVEVASIEEAHKLLPGFLGAAAPILFGIALLCAGQSSTLTGTLAGQIVMEGYLHLRIAPWLRRLVTRMIALIPAVVVIALTGEGSTQQLLVLSQVILSLQLSFAVIPLIHFTSNRRNMGEFATPWWGAGPRLADGRDHRRAQRQAGARQDRRVGGAGGRVGRRFGPIPLSWVGRRPLYGLVGGRRLALLAWVTLKPWSGPRPPGRPRRASSSTGPTPCGPARWRRSAWPWSTTRPTREILNRALEPGTARARPSWSCSTSSTRR